MRRETSLYARPRKTIWLIIFLVTVCLILGFFLFKKAYDKHKAYETFVASVPEADEVASMDVYIVIDGTLIFSADNLYSFVILNEDSQVGTLLSHTIGGNTINAVFMPVVSDNMYNLILEALELNIDIRNLYVPKDTDPAFLEAFQEKNSRSQTVICSGGEYRLFKDTAVYVIKSKESLSLRVTHGDNSFLYSHDQAVGTLFEQEQAIVTIMPYEVFNESKIRSDYVFFEETEVSAEQLRNKTDYYSDAYKRTNIFCSSTGNQLSFDVYLTATGRLQGE